MHLVEGLRDGSIKRLRLQLICKVVLHLRCQEANQVCIVCLIEQELVRISSATHVKRLLRIHSSNVALIRCLLTYLCNQFKLPLLDLICDVFITSWLLHMCIS